MSGSRTGARGSDKKIPGELKVNYLVLNQYRQGSSYKDIVGELYHFPTRYKRAFSELPIAFVYYEPREGGQQVYFGTGIVNSISDDTEDVGHAYAEVCEYKPFASEVRFYSGPGGTWENPKTMRNSVRRITFATFREVLASGGIEELPELKFHESAAQVRARELDSYPPPGKRSSFILRRIRRILETYERPSAITNWVKSLRGDSCQLCGKPGFVKRDGSRYCEIHHLFHLSDDPPADCLQPECLVVLCANCHRRMHYAEVGVLTPTEVGWKVMIDGEEIIFVTKALSKKSSGTQPNG